MGRLVLVDKPAGPTSHDAVETLRRTLGVKKAGHCGSLDPMATGLLLILTGRGTRLAEVFAGHDKRYEAVVRFGAATDTDDAAGSVLRRAEGFRLEPSAVEAALRELAGRRSQRPPLFSAIKQAGVPLYKLARRGDGPAELPERPVRLHALEMTAIGGDTLSLRVHCSAGTYVRALARDLGDLLGIPAHLAALRRMQSGPFLVTDAVPLDRLLWDDSSAPLGLDLPAALAYLPAARASADYAERIRHGRQPLPGELDLGGPLPELGAWLRIVDDAGRLLGLARVEEDPEPCLRLRRSLPG